MHRLKKVTCELLKIVDIENVNPKSLHTKKFVEDFPAASSPKSESWERVTTWLTHLGSDCCRACVAACEDSKSTVGARWFCFTAVVVAEKDRRCQG